MLYDWEGNRRYCSALAMCHRLSGIATCGLSGLEKGNGQPTYALHWNTAVYLYLFMLADDSQYRSLLDMQGASCNGVRQSMFTHSDLLHVCNGRD